MQYFPFLLFVMLISLSSCSTTEEIWINKDGSLRREISVDVSYFASFANMKDQFGNLSNLDSLEFDSTRMVEENIERIENNEQIIMREDQETLMDESEYEANNAGKDFMLRLFQYELLDTTFDMITLMESMAGEKFPGGFSMQALEDDPSWTAEQKTYVKSLMKMKVRVRINKDKGAYNIGFIEQFKNDKEMSASSNWFNSLGALIGQERIEQEDNEMMNTMMQLMSGSTPAYQLKKGEFSIRKPESNPADILEELGPMAPMFTSTYIDYKYIVHVPNKVKNVNNSNASIENNTVTLEAPTKIGASKKFDLTIKYK